MFKKLLLLIKNIRIVQRFFISYSVLIILVVSSWVFSYTTTKELEKSFVELEYQVFPSLLSMNELEHDFNTTLFAAYDYLTSGNVESKNTYVEHLSEMSQALNAIIYDREVIEEKVDAIIDRTDEVIALYEQDPNDPKLKQELTQLSQMRDHFNQFLEQEINDRLRDKIAQQTNIVKERGHNITWYLIVVSGVIILSTALLLLFMRYNIILPVNEVTEAAKRFGRGELVQVKVEGKDEIGILSAAFNKMIQDITTSHQALQQELTKTKEMERQKSEFLSMAAHQLRTPLAGLRWLLTLTLGGDLGKITSEQHHHWQEGLENINRMIQLVNRMLDIAEVEELKVQYKLQPLAITDLLNDVLKMLKLKVQKKKIKMTLQALSEVPRVRMDREKMEIALQNIIDNAIKYSPENSSVDIQIINKEKHVLITIQDHGYGIPKQQQPLVFTKFFRGSNILKDETDIETIGTGLGLFIAKDIITKHDGRISFQSEENKGTIFSIELPLEPQARSLSP